MRLTAFAAYHFLSALRETITLWLKAPGKKSPPRECFLREYYCSYPEIDYRIVALDVVYLQPPQRILATIQFGWESLEFYLKFSDNLEQARAIRAGLLDRSGPRGPWGRIALEAVRKRVLSDPRNIAHFRRHYLMLRRALRRRAREAESMGLACPSDSPPQPGDLVSTIAALLELAKPGRSKTRR